MKKKRNPDSSIVGDSPYFNLFKSGQLFKDDDYYNGHVLPTRKASGCHVCGETHTTLFKDGKDENGNKLYICKDCKDLKALNEEDENNV